jgi:NAD(P)-dependent dehydrogenase (short-subunit alcohol dehydrogenase family)
MRCGRAPDGHRLLRVLLETVRTTAMVFLILIGAHIFSPFLALTRIPANSPTWSATGPVGARRAGDHACDYIVLGMFMEGFAMMVLTLPIVFPIITALGYDPDLVRHLHGDRARNGPDQPAGGHQRLRGEGRGRGRADGAIFAGILPFWLAMAVCVALLIAFPQIAMFLPDTMQSEHDVARMAEETVKTFGAIDILVNNAAMFSTLELRPFENIPPEEFRRVMEVNIMGVWLCARACAPHMRKGGHGRIINLASGAPLKGVPLFLHYIASKGAVIAMTRGLARELGKDGITVNSLAPGFTLSENVAKHAAHVKVGEASRASRAIPRDETPEDLVGAVSFLASDDAAFVTGQTLVVDGGSAML